MQKMHKIFWDQNQIFSIFFVERKIFAEKIEKLSERIEKKFLR